MLTEVARVVAVETDSLWVETIRKTTCGSCAAQKGCGHGLMNQYASGRRSYIRVLPGARQVSECRIDDQVLIAIPEEVILRGSMIAYLLPVLLMIAGAAAGAWLFPQWQDPAAAIGAFAGMGAGYVLVRLHSVQHRSDASFQPTLLDILKSSAAPIQLYP